MAISQTPNFVLARNFEARARIELAHNCFADSRVTTSPTRLIVKMHRTLLTFYTCILYLIEPHKTTISQAKVENDLI